MAALVRTFEWIGSATWDCQLAIGPSWVASAWKMQPNHANMDKRESCITDCDVATTVTSSLPAYAMNAHGNLAEQVRDWGPYPGLWTDTVTDADPDQIAVAGWAAEVAMAPEAALSAGGCSGCHQMAGQLVGPGFAAIRAKYAGQEHAAYVRDKIVNGGAGVWGSMPMPPMPSVDDEALQQIVAWLISGEE